MDRHDAEVRTASERGRIGMSSGGPASTVLDMIGGYRATALVSTAARLGLADELAAGPLSVDALAAAMGTRPDRLRQFLGALVATGLLSQEDDGTFGLTPAGQLLKSDADGSLRSAAIYFGAVSAPSFEALPEVLRSEASGFEHRHGTSFYGYLDDHPELAEHYNAVIAVDGLGSAISSAHDFAPARSVVDVGGGRGSTLAELLQAQPQLRGTLQEIPHVIQDAEVVLDAPTLQGRATTVVGSFLDRVEPGADVYLLVRVLPNWADDEALAILRNCAAAMPPKASLLIVDAEMAEHPSLGSFAPIGDLHALVHFGGKLRSRSELAALLTRAGLTLRAVRSLPGIPHWAVFESGHAS